MTASNMEWALWAVDRGFVVFPCSPGAKRPAVTDDWEGRATRDRLKVEALFRGPCNVGIACGPSGLVVIDPDQPKPGKTPPAPDIMNGYDALVRAATRAGEELDRRTLTVRTPSGGWHLYYRAPAGVHVRNSAGKIAWHVDVRAEGGYVVGPGSTIGGKRYALVDPKAEVAPLPAWLIAAAATTPKAVLHPARTTQPWPSTSASPGRHSDRYLYKALRGCVSRVLSAPEGSRNETLNAAAYGAAKAGADPYVVRLALVDAALCIGLSAAEARRTVESGVQAGSQARAQP